SRGEPERMAQLKFGISFVAERYPRVPIVPVFMHGLGKSMPRGEWLPVPYFCDVFVGLPLKWRGDRESFMGELEQSFHKLKEKLAAPEYL
ncbi:MAG: 1-acyl-sn-glycerol-3-phosphate acyltransferase, partial [Acidobacteria bacterium]|nr:1-acyl-sn-glycerol-3-phosphate acyltransferase [Acidobacteriota bacterium]